MTDLRTPPAAASFDLDELRNEHDRVVVRGRWNGTRGMRFVRPTLLVGDREVLATLDHKPWAPDAGPIWTAAFPWQGPDVEPGDAALAVTPAVTVPLVPGGGPATAPPQERTAPSAAAPPSAAGAPVVEPPEPTADPVPEFLVRETSPAAEEQRDVAALQRRLEHAERERDEALAEQRRLRLETEDALAARRRAEADRDDALAERRRADGWAEQQNRHVSSVQRDAEQVIAEREAALSAQRQAERERDDAVRQAEQARDARDEALIAFRALERRVRVGDELASSVERPRRRPSTPDPEALEHAPDDEPDEDAPLGVVAVPAARDMAADVHHVDRLSARSISDFDMWAVRILGSVAAVCFLGLMFLLALVFV